MIVHINRHGAALRPAFACLDRQRGRCRRVPVRALYQVAVLTCAAPAGVLLGDDYQPALLQ